nr:trypsin-like peptidase domain-containing protein [Lachnospiraceae bacterium]
DDSVYTAEVKGTDSSADLAVIQIKTSDLSEETLNNIKVATLGDSDEVRVGEQAIAIGNALGYGTSVTVGIVSAKDREMAGEDYSIKLLQTDAAINPGNSGGALVNSKGEVIGINSAKYASEEVEGMGFAIPISTALPIIQDILNAESIDESERGYLGITGTDISETYAEYYGMPEGVYVTDVSEGSPAEEAGIQKGDIITSFNGTEIKTIEEFQTKISAVKGGTKVKIIANRIDNGEYKENEITVTLGKRGDYVKESESNASGENSEDSNSQGQVPNGQAPNGQAPDGQAPDGNGPESGSEGGPSGNQGGFGNGSSDSDGSDSFGLFPQQ